jgi:Zn-finger nucleic acid-binding protein
MDCGNCGAPMRTVPSGTHLVCDYCTSFHFPDKNADRVAILGGPGERGCPVCCQPLVAAAIEGSGVEHCTRCQGLLADRRAFFQIVHQLRAHHRGERLEPRPIADEERARVLMCPGCRRPMEAHPYYGPGNVLIDSCGVCALIWLDHGEVATIARS